MTYHIDFGYLPGRRQTSVPHPAENWAESATGHNAMLRWLASAYEPSAELAVTAEGLAVERDILAKAQKGRVSDATGTAGVTGTKQEVFISRYGARPGNILT